MRFVCRVLGPLLFAVLALIPLVVESDNTTTVVQPSAHSFQLVAHNPYPWPHNGCTASPNHIGVANFTHPCNQHDGCYANRWAPRAACDQWFYNDLMKECDKIAWPRGIPTIANTYVTAVRVLGERYYNSNGTHVRISTPMRIG